MASGTLSITRRWGGPVYPGPFPVEVDGKVIASLRSMETVELPVEAGRHTVRLGSGRHVSPARSFEIADGEMVSFWCRGLMLWPLMVAALFKPDLWITFRSA
ncbi:MAG: hypothetical protein J2P58_11275 [Acidimicrobiaceae bacterium]|nr:hypothetical protein [Acidimicrobiaceae bacterium]MBO0747464.1 hypothetical protein [Acidimicrobiaceae bacterium]